MEKMKPGQVWLSSVGNVYRIVRMIDSERCEARLIAGGKTLRDIPIIFVNGFQAHMRLLSSQLSDNDYQKIADDAMSKFIRHHRALWES